MSPHSGARRRFCVHGAEHALDDEPRLGDGFGGGAGERLRREIAHSGALARRDGEAVVEEAVVEEEKGTMRTSSEATGERRNGQRRMGSDRRGGLRGVAGERRLVDQRGLALAMADALADILTWEQRRGAS